jgi:hypothetical protein
MVAALLAALLAFNAPNPDDGYLYKTLLVRAAPGDLLQLIELYQEMMPAFDAAGEERPLMMRHTQGDHWDLLLLYPMGSFADYYSADRIAARDRAAGSGRSLSELMKEPDGLIAWREETYVVGPAVEVVQEAFAEHSYYHVEMFIALAGRRAKLLEERHMENKYLEGIDRPQNLIFTRVAGAAWDSYTIGFYDDIKHFAGSADVPDEQAEAAARAAGFEGADRIGSYMRTLIQRHQDTLATAMR